MSHFFQSASRFDAAKVLRARLSEVPTNYRYAFLFGIAFSFFANGMQFVHIVFTEDGLIYWREMQTSYWQSGRWMIDAYRRLQEGLTFPILTGVVCSMSVSAAACFNGSLWKTRSLLPLLLISGLYTSYPAFANAYSFQFMATTWPFACFFSVLAAYLVQQQKAINFLLAVASMTIALAFYQSFISLTAALCAITLMFKLLNAKSDTKSLLLLTGRYIAFGVASCALYLASVSLSKAIHPQSGLFEYMGMEKMGQVALARVPGLVLRAYEGFFGVFSGYFFSCPRYVRFALWGMMAVLVLWLLKSACEFRHRQKGWRLRLLCGVLLICLLPLAAFIISVFAPESHLTIFHTFGFISVLAAAAYAGTERVQGLARNVTLILATILILGFVNRSSAIGLKSHLYTEAAFRTAQSVLARLESLPEFHNEKRPPVIFVGHLASEDQEPPFSEKMRGIKTVPPGFGRGEAWLMNLELSNLYAMMDVDIPFCEAEFARAELLAKDMPAWPAAGSVEAFKDIIVVNLGHCMYVDLESVRQGTYHATAHVNSEKPWLFSWSVMDGSRAIFKSEYSKSPHFDYTFKQSGKYRIQCQARHRDHGIRWISPALIVTATE